MFLIDNSFVSTPAAQPPGAESGPEGLVEDTMSILPIDTHWEGELISHMDLSNIDTQARALTHHTNLVHNVSIVLRSHFGSAFLKGCLGPRTENIVVLHILQFKVP